MSIDWDKPYTTRNGCEVRIYTTDGGDLEKSVIGERLDISGNWVLFKRPKNGQVRGDGKMDSHDIVNVPQQHTLTVNVNRRNRNKINLCGYESTEAADDQATGYRIACIKLTFTEGEGL